jgi:type III secretion system low calcium response chaperone LcrH/SycD
MTLNLSANELKREPSYNNFMGTMSVTKDELKKYVDSVTSQIGDQVDSKENDLTPAKTDDQSYVGKLSLKEVLHQLLEHSKNLKDSYKLTTDQLEGLYSVAYHAFAQNDFQQAIGIFRLLCLLSPLEKRYAFALGLSLEKNKCFFEAATAYLFCSQIEDQNPIPFFRAAICFIELEEEQLAANFFRKTIKKCRSSEDEKHIKERSKIFLLQIRS